MSREELRLASKGTFETITCTQMKLIFWRSQPGNKHNQQHGIKSRIGRITASVFHQVARASLAPPPASLVNKIVNEQDSKVSECHVVVVDLRLNIL